jgi:putative ABC transport system ATP-binding protein
MESYALETRDLTKTYESAAGPVYALDEVNLRIKKNEAVAIMGPSGSGKSTFLNMVGLLDKPTNGDVFIDGASTSTLNARQATEIRRSRIGFIFQQYNLISTLTARENIQLPLYLQGKSIDEINRKISNTVEKLDLDERFLEHFPKQLSGGQQQRVAIARSLIADPAIVLGDEPTGNLDSKSSGQTMELLKSLHETMGLTLVVVTNDPIVARYMERKITMRDGRLFESK